MTQMGRYLPPDRQPGELGVHSVDHFSLYVPDLAKAEHFYKSFGMDVQEESAKLVLRTSASKHIWGTIAEGSRKCLRYVSFGAFEGDLPRFKQKMESQGIKLLDPPKEQDGGGLWFRDPDQNLIEIKVAEKCSPNQKSRFANPSVPGGQRGAPMRGEVTPVRPNRMSHVLLFTTDVERTLRFYEGSLGLRLTDRGGHAIAFMHGIHGSDHHMFAFALSPNPGFHHASWGVDSIHDVGMGAMQMAESGYDAGWGLLRHVLGSNYSHYVRDPWGSYFEYTTDIDYIPVECEWEAGHYKPEDSIYLWGPSLPPDFIVNQEVPEVAAQEK
jgi:catechol 2,3-dioxygenase-like lactoylglutathione lyase family enzyme